MDVKEFAKHFDRMCDTYDNCVGCPMNGEFIISCTDRALTPSQVDEVVEIVEKWNKEHPIITNADKFKEVFGMTWEESIERANHDWGSWWDAPYEAPEEADNDLR